MSNEWRRIALQIFVLKLVLFLAGIFFFKLQARPDAPPPPNVAVDIWYRWDALRYLAIADNGYVKAGRGVENIVYYPLYPYLMRAMGAVVGNTKVGGLLVAHLFSFIGLLIFYALARFELGPPRAQICLWAFMLFPTAYFLQVPYTEGLFLTCAAGCFLAARRENWPLAGALGGLAVLTRITGMCLFPALAIEFWLQRREKKTPLWKSIFIALLPLACGIYLLINKNATGDYFGFMTFQSSFWHRDLTWPWTALLQKIKLLGSTKETGYWFNVVVMELAAVLFLVIATLRSWRKDRLSYAVYSTGVTLLCLSTSFILSVPRYALGAFPLFFLHPPLDRKSALTWGLGGISAVILLAYLSRYVMGFWAF